MRMRGRLLVWLIAVVATACSWATEPTPSVSATSTESPVAPPHHAIEPTNIGTVPPQYGAQYPLSRDAITDLQKSLQAAGYYKGGNTSYGAWNPRTGQAVKDFQKAHYLKPTGQLDRETAKALWHLSEDK